MIRREQKAARKTLPKYWKVETGERENSIFCGFSKVIGK